MIWVSIVLTLLCVSVLCVLFPCYRKARQVLKEHPIADCCARLRAQPSYCALEDISPELKMTVIAQEDPEFFWHRGVIWRQVFRALIANAKHGKIISGASTITQQLAKNLYLSPEKTYRRKLTELFLAYRLEKTLSKADILELYLNAIYYGRGQHGITDACQVYFRRRPADITVNQALTIAALLPAPDAYDPIDKREMFLKARSRILWILIQNELISAADANRLTAGAFDDPLEEPFTQALSAQFRATYQLRAAGNKAGWNQKKVTFLGREWVVHRRVYNIAAVARNQLRKLYHRGKSLRLRNRRPTIIANNCVGTIIYSDMGLPFCSPTINLAMTHEDFIRFVTDLPAYLASDVYEVTDKAVYFPVGQLRTESGTIRLDFHHYRSFSEARDAWNRRKARVDFDNLYIIEFREKAQAEMIEEFARLPYPNKLYVTNENPTSYDFVAVLDFLNEDSYRTGQILKYRPMSLKRYLDDLDYIRFLNRRRS